MVHVSEKNPALTFYVPSLINVAEVSAPGVIVLKVGGTRSVGVSPYHNGRGERGSASANLSMSKKTYPVSCVPFIAYIRLKTQL